MGPGTVLLLAFAIPGLVVLGLLIFAHKRRKRAGTAPGSRYDTTPDFYSGVALGSIPDFDFSSSEDGWWDGGGGDFSGGGASGDY